MEDDAGDGEDVPMQPATCDVPEDPSGPKVACDRCRRRKTRCDRLDPCSQCTRSNVTCTYPRMLKPKEKRQRIHVSTSYEQKIDQIVRKLGVLDQKVSLLSRGTSATSPQLSNLQYSTAINSEQSASPLRKYDYPEASGDRTRSQNDSPRTEYEGESSLAAHASFATGHLEDLVNSSPAEAMSLELTSIVEVLREAVDAQKEEIDTLELLYPRAKSLAPGSSLRDLPMPPIESALACLQMVKEHPHIKWMWVVEFHYLHQFTDYVLRVYSRGNTTDADLIIVNAGLYWLFEACITVVDDRQVEAQYQNHVALCRSNVETVLAQLPFYFPTTIDYVFAMSISCTYCLLNGKPSAARNFITSAANLCLSLGLHNARTLGGGTPEGRQVKLKLFWSVFVMERNLSLRLGRSSCIPDHEITVPRPIATLAGGDPSDPILLPVWPLWIDIAVLQGKIYDKIYSPRALLQPTNVRTSHAMELASELKAIIERTEAYKWIENQTARRELGPDLHEFFYRTDRVLILSLLALVYRAIPAEAPNPSGVCMEAVITARDALVEHTKCLSMLFDKQLDTDHLETYITWSLLQSPFIPVIILFCHVIDTSDAADLESLKALTDTLQLTSPDFKQTYAKQLRLFKALYDVAQRYVEVKAKGSSHNLLSMNNQPEGSLDPLAQSIRDTSMFAGSSFDASRSNTITRGDEANAGQNFIHMPWNGNDNGGVSQFQETLYPPMDPQSIKLGDWFHSQHEIFRLLEDDL
ncbi:hypothetical protein F4776DRAFT_414610 [Hypoxylon sp. NC0597]|nr:hypothetical protein F4776DRAFT_414610 [Hypoxylon sp. NC0597]